MWILHEEAKEGGRGCCVDWGRLVIGRRASGGGKIADFSGQAIYFSQPGR